MWGAAAPRPRYALVAAAALAAVAVTAGAGWAAPPSAPEALPQLWAVEVDGKTLGSLDRALLKRLQSARVVLVASSRGLTAAERRRLERVGARWNLGVLAPLRVSKLDAQAVAARCIRLELALQGARCGVRAHTRADAVRLTRQPAVDLVVLPVPSRRSFLRLAGRAESSRLLGVRDLSARPYRPASWRTSIAEARRSPYLDLGVRPTGARRKQALARFLSQLVRLDRSDRISPERPRAPVVTDATATSVSLSWEPAAAAAGDLVGYGLYDDGAYLGLSRSPASTFAGLSCSEHLFQVDAVDRAGNRSAKSSVGAAPPGCDAPPSPSPSPPPSPSPSPSPSPDVQPPSVPQGMAFTGKTETSVTVSWNASTDDVGVAGYRLFRDGALAGTTQGLSYTYGGLVCGTSYLFALEAYDAAGNASNRAEAAGVTSTDPCDDPPPPPPPSPPPPESEPEPTLFVASTGSDGNPCTRTAPCASFHRAYALAAAGAVVEVAAGTYSSQTIRAAGARTAPAVIFRPAQGERVVLDGLKFGANGDPGLGPDHITVRGMETTYRTSEPGAGNQRGIFVGPGSSFITLEHMDAGSIDTWFADNVTVTGGDYGPCHAVWGSSNVCGNNKFDVSTNVTVDGARFHDYRFDETCFTVSGADCHWECMYVNAGENNTIRNSTFSGCAIFDIFATISGPDAGRIGHRNLTIENNWFAAPWTESPSGGSASRPTAVSLAWCQNSSFGYKDVLVRFNSFQANTTLQLDQNPTCVFDNVRVIGNVMMWDGCQSRWTFAYNVWTTVWRTGSCSSTDVILGKTIPYVNGGSGSDLDYHLADDGAIDNLVPLSAGCPATDIDGDPRPAGSRCDAGADERF